MKKAVFIYNPNSGKKTFRKNRIITDFQKIEEIFHSYQYEVEFMKTKYAGHAKEIVSGLKDIDLVISLGGDGTFNEVVSGNLKRKNKLVISHLPYGTTNDIGAMFGLGKNLYKNLHLLLSGQVRNIDICLVNNEPFVYVAGFGKFMNIPYDTKRNLKKKIGYSAYLVNGVGDFFFNQTPLYEMTYEINGEKYHGLYSFAIISNATRIAGINNFYKNVTLNDGKFEVLFCNLQKKQDIIKSLIYLKTSDITKVPGFYFHKVDHLKIKFQDKLRYPWCLDGEKMNANPQEYDITVDKNTRMLIPNKSIDKLFIKEDK